MTSGTECGFEIRGADRHVDIVLHPDLQISGEGLSIVTNRLANQFGTELSVGTGRGDDFVIRLHDTSPSVAAELQSVDLFPELAAQGVNSDEVVAVRYVHEGLACIDIRQKLPVGQLLAETKRLSVHIGRTVVISLKDGCLYFWVNTALGRSDRHDDALRELLRPKYMRGSEITGGVHEGLVYFSFSVLSDFDVSSLRLDELDFVLADPAPATQRDFSYDVLRVYVAGNLDDVDELWRQASKVAFHVGVHPVGEFIFFRSKRLKWSYDPPALSDW